MALSENLQFIRAQAGITQEQLEVSRQSVSKWEGGQSFPEMETLLRICDLYDVNMDTLLRGSVEESRVEDTAKYDAFMTRFARRIAGATGGIIAGMMLAATALYVGLGLAMGLWRTAWWVFAVGGILCGVVAVALDPYKGED